MGGGVVRGGGGGGRGGREGGKGRCHSMDRATEATAGPGARKRRGGEGGFRIILLLGFLFAARRACVTRVVSQSAWPRSGPHTGGLGVNNSCVDRPTLDPGQAARARSRSGQRRHRDTAAAQGAADEDSQPRQMRAHGGIPRVLAGRGLARPGPARPRASLPTRGVSREPWIFRIAESLRCTKSSSNL